jgi:hypothetical protein
MNDWFGDGAQAEFCVARSVDVAPKPTSIDHVTGGGRPDLRAHRVAGSGRAGEARPGPAGVGARGGR